MRFTALQFIKEKGLYDEYLLRINSNKINRKDTGYYRTDKYREQKKKYMKEYSKTEKQKEYQKEYQKMYRMKNKIINEN